MENQVFQFTVIKHSASGLVVRLKDGRVGLIRVRETSWSAEDRRRWQELYPVNWKSQAVPIGEIAGEPLELSIRLAEHDPWQGVPGRYQLGQVVRGVVSGVVNYGAFVELSTGITGLLHASQLPPDVKGDPLNLFWPGDHVLVRILQVDLRRRRISLKLEQNRGDLVKASSTGLSAGKSGAIPRSDEPAPAVGTLDWFLHAGYPARDILIIDDDQDHSKAMSIWLNNIGQRVRIAPTGAQGLEMVDVNQPDLAFIDVGLPDRVGIEVAGEIRQRWPEVRCILTTDWGRADEYAAELEATQASGIGFLLKPLLPDDLIDILSEQVTVEAPSSSPELSGGIGDGFTVTDYSTQPLQKSVRQHLNRCQEQCNFELAILFSLDPIQRVVDIVASSGGVAFQNQALVSLIYSPVRDVAEDGEEIRLADLAEHDWKRFRYLLQFYPLKACVGVPVPSGSQVRHALFLLDSRPGSISDENFVYLRATALAISALFERRVFQEQAILVQRTALLGHLSRALVHEVNHNISPLNISLELLERTVGDLEKQVTTGQEVSASLQEMRELMGDLRKLVRAMTNTTRQFGRIVTRPRNEILRVDEVVQQAITLLADVSDRAKVQVVLLPPDDFLVMRSQGTAVEQVLINVLLNAIQQISENYPRKGGRVHVSFETAPVDDGIVHCRVLIQDNGPGIHVRQWDQVFEVGYTTREDGSGLGLFISRSLLEALGGRLYVEESYILGGTVFALELPCQI